jgi:hypothetical protein
LLGVLRRLPRDLALALAGFGWVGLGLLLDHDAGVWRQRAIGIITWALVVSAVRRQVVRGGFRAHPFEAGGDDQRSTGMRAWTHWAANITPNAIAIDIDKERNLSLVHDLIPNRNSEKPA